MNKLFFSLMFALTGAPLFAQEYIDAGSEVSGTWKKSLSPYIVQGVIFVPQGKTLTIEPGVVVRFQTGDEEDYSDPDFPLGMLRVMGTLIAKGTAKDRILFTNMEEDGESDNWGAVHICSDKNKSTFSFCTFEFARGVVNIELEDGQTVNATGALSFIDCGGTVENCVFRGSWAGINAKGDSEVKVRFSDFVANKYGMESNGEAKIILNSCIVHGNENGFFINREEGVSLSYCFVEKGALHENAKDVKGNILNKKSPLFKNEDEGDFRLDKKSPCFKKGEGGKNMGAY